MVMGMTHGKQKELARRLLRSRFQILWEECIPIDLIVLGADRMAEDDHFSYYALGKMNRYLMENVGCSREIADEVTRECFHEWMEGF